MFEPQDHPHDVLYPGGPPVAPYDSAGWTLAYQMGVVFDRVLDAFSGPFHEVSGPAPRPTGKVDGASKPAGFLLDHRVNDSFIAVNRLLKQGEEVYWIKDPLAVDGKTYPPGAVFISAGTATMNRVRATAESLGLTATGIGARPRGG
jgi:hypothetical protein